MTQRMSHADRAKRRDDIRLQAQAAVPLTTLARDYGLCLPYVRRIVGDLIPDLPGSPYEPPRRFHPKSRERLETVLEFVNQGMTRQEIANAMGISYQIVATLIRRTHGVRAVHATRKTARNEMILNALKDGCSSRQVAELTGLSHQRISQLAQKAGYSLADRRRREMKTKIKTITCEVCGREKEVHINSNARVCSNRCGIALRTDMAMVEEAIQLYRHHKKWRPVMRVMGKNPVVLTHFIQQIYRALKIRRRDETIHELWGDKVPRYLTQQFCNNPQPSQSTGVAL
jgi:predicted transcriptional regulator